MSQPLFTSRVDWTRWASHAPERDCAACGRPFQPNHPRRRYCTRDDCPGRKPPARPRRRPPSGKAHAKARARGITGFLGDITITLHRSNGPDGSSKMVADACREWARAEQARDPKAVHAALVRLAAASTARGLKLMPPALHPDPDLEDDDDAADADRPADLAAAA